MSRRICVNGAQAMLLANAANRQPEVLDATRSTWRPATSLREGRSYAENLPDSVRFSGDLRIVLEDVLKMAIPPGADLVEIMRQAAVNGVAAEAISLLRRIA